MLNLHWGFNNVQIKEGDEWKATSQTNYHVLWTVQLPCNVPDNDV